MDLFATCLALAFGAKEKIFGQSAGGYLGFPFELGRRLLYELKLRERYSFSYSEAHEK